jgi:hypothetical protein
MKFCSVLLLCLAICQATPLFTEDDNGAVAYSCALHGSKYVVTTGFDKTAVAWAKYLAPFDNPKSQGYGLLWLSSNPSFPDPVQVEAAGYLEGWISVKSIALSFQNFWNDDFNGTGPVPRLNQFTVDNLAFTQALVKGIDYNHPKADFVWQYNAQVGLVMKQFNGILNGYNDNRGSYPVLTALQLHLLNMDGDMDDLLPAFNPRGSFSRKRTRPTTPSQESNTQQEHEQDDPDMDLSPERLKFIETHMHCSSLVKLSADGQELFAAHEMWSSFSQMIETYKSYNFPLTLASTKSKKVSFSSYPGYISSEDDFYITDSGFTVMETTNAIMNMSLYDRLTPQTLMSWIRVVVANRMAQNGSDWARIFAIHNSGTYNNQWIIIDYNLFTPGQPLKDNTLWILEQAPGFTEAADVTSVLRQQSYWPSYNIPYFPDMYVITGNQAAWQKYGDVWSYQRTPRAQIFRRDQDSVKDISSLQTLMRSNDFEHDPLSLGCPNFQLACRGDLAPPVPQPSWGGLCHAGAFGATNGKVTSSDWIKQGQASIICGPTSQTLPPFTWSQGKWTTPHAGQPDVFNFDWVHVRGW